MVLRFHIPQDEGCPISLIRLVSMIHHDCHGFIKSRLGDLGVSSGQFPLMFLIYQNEGVNQGQAASALGLDKGTVARGMMRLEGAGLVLRERDRHDRRNYRLRLSDEGREVMERLEDVRLELEAGLVQGLSDEERSVLRELLQKVHGNVAEGKDE